VTDANLVLGRIPPALLGGEVPLNLERARQAIHDHVAVPLGLDLYEAAAGIVQIVNNNMGGTLRVVSVERGYDPERFALVAFGGAGPLHAGPLAQLLGTPTILIPPYPGLLSALGLLATDIQHDVMRTFVQRGPQYDLPSMEAVYQALHAEAAAHLAAEGLPPERQSFQRLADLRYARQGFEVTVDFPGEAVSAAAVAHVLQAFHQRHEQLYTYAAPDTPVEIVNLRLRAVGQMEKLALPRIATAPVAGMTPDPVQTRPVYFSGEGFSDTPVYTRATLQATHVVPGPAIVEQLDATTVIFPGQEAVVDLYGNLLIHLLRS
jgi:N-methylhydantoinase A